MIGPWLALSFWESARFVLFRLLFSPISLTSISTTTWRKISGGRDVLISPWFSLMETSISTSSRFLVYVFCIANYADTHTSTRPEKPHGKLSCATPFPIAHLNVPSIFLLNPNPGNYPKTSFPTPPTLHISISQVFHHSRKSIFGKFCL